MPVGQKGEMWINKQLMKIPERAAEIQHIDIIPAM
jgi:hypothetical protein